MTTLLAIAGSGGHGLDGHVRPGLKLGFDVVAVYDPLAASVAKLNSVIGKNLKSDKSFEDMVNRKDVGAVLITSKDEYHAEQLLAAVRARKPTLCDKPLAIDIKGLQLVRKAFNLAKQNNVFVMSCHPRREHDDLPYGWVKKQLSNLLKRYGALEHVTLVFSYHRPDEPWKSARSLLLDHFPHEIDFLRWLLGNQSFTAKRQTDSYNKYTVEGKMGQGVTFLCHGTRKLADRKYPESISLRFKKAICIVHTATGEIGIYDRNNNQIDRAKISPTNYDRRSDIIMREFAAGIKRGVDAKLLDDLWVVNESAVKLATSGSYSFSG